MALRTVCTHCGEKVKISDEGEAFRCPCCISPLSLLEGFCSSCGGHITLLVPENMGNLSRDFRESPRFLIEWPLEFELVEKDRKNPHISNPSRGIALNISGDGLYFHTTANISDKDMKRLEKGDLKWVISLWIPNNPNPLTFFARDKWLNRENLFTGIGVEFEDSFDFSGILKEIDRDR